MRYLSILVIAAVFSLASCGLFKKNTANTVKEGNTTEQKEIFKPDVNLVKYIDSLETSYLNYENLSMKFSGELINSEGKSTPLKGLIRMRKDSFIWISVRPGLGIELARAVFTTDSVKLLDRLKSNYFLGSYSYLDSAFSVYADYNMLQSILTNEFFVYQPDTTLTPVYGKFQIKRTSREVMLSRTDSLSNDSYSQTVTVDKMFRVNEMTAKSKPLQRFISIDFSDFEDFQGKALAKKLVTKISDKGKETVLKFEFSDFRTDVEAKNTFKIPNSYTEMKFEKKE